MPERRDVMDRGRADWVAHILPLLRPFRGRLALIASTIILDALFTLLRPWPLKVVIDCVLLRHATRLPVIGHFAGQLYPTTSVVLTACGVTLLIATCTGLLTWYYTAALGRVGRMFAYDMRRTLFAHLQRLSLKFHDRQRTGDLITRLTSDVTSVQKVIAQAPIPLINNAFLLLGMLGLLLWLNWEFALIAMSVAPILFVVIFRYTNRIKRAARIARASDGMLASLAQETLTSLRMVQSLAREADRDARFETQADVSMQAYLESIRYQARAAPLVDILAALGLALVMWFGARSVRAGTITTGDMIVFFAYVTNLYAPMKALSKLNFTFNKASAGAERIGEVLAVDRKVVDLPDARPAPRFRGAISFRGVSFEYEPGRPVLQGLDLDIAPGEKIAIVGVNGAGKSTLVSLLPRLYDPTAGSVEIDGRDVRTYTLASLRAQIGVVLQESLLFSGSIRDNIALGRPPAGAKRRSGAKRRVGTRTTQAIALAIEQAGAADLVERLPKGWDTEVAERGSTLSGGEKQRIAIARAIVRDAPILILDEPTSSLDPASEHALVETLEHAARGRTTLLIAHRLATARIADRIVVIENGRVIEQGTHADLLARAGHYAQLCALQPVARRVERNA